MERDQDTVLAEVLPQMLSTQLLAADVYATFLLYARGNEGDVYHQLLKEELSHVRFVSMMLEEQSVPEVPLPEPSLDAFRHLCENARHAARHSPFERTLWALRLEHAEIDFGLESFVAIAVSEWPDTPVCPGPVTKHYLDLIEWARRYEAAREIAIQIARLEEHVSSAPSCDREECG